MQNGKYLLRKRTIFDLKFILRNLQEMIIKILVGLESEFVNEILRETFILKFLGSRVKRPTRIKLPRNFQITYDVEGNKSSRRNKTISKNKRVKSQKIANGIREFSNIFHFFF